MPTVRELHEGETHLAAAALLELRPSVAGADALVAAIDRDQRPSGYRLIGSFDGGYAGAACVAGFRVQQNLASGGTGNFKHGLRIVSYHFARRL